MSAINTRFLLGSEQRNETISPMVPRHHAVEVELEDEPIASEEDSASSAVIELQAHHRTNNSSPKSNSA